LNKEIETLKQYSPPVESLAVVADVTKEEDVKNVFEKIRKWGTIEVLIHNASAEFKIRQFKDISTKEFEESWRGNCLSGFLTTKEGNIEV
jgi:NAD(P)-dependent dehydrogenase (short-subunit alcohol dehydrogenase family)